MIGTEQDFTMPAGDIYLVNTFGMAAQVNGISLNPAPPPFLFPQLALLDGPVALIILHTGKVATGCFIYMPVFYAKMLATI